MKQILDLGRNPSLKQQVYDHLLQMIIRGELEPGERLTEDNLSQAMHISRAPIREALNMLERDGFATITPRRGTVVAAVTNKDIEDIWTCRLALEPFAAKLSIHRIPEDAVRVLLDEVTTLETAPYNLDKYVSSDIAVHELLYMYLDNPYMKSILENLKAHSTRTRWLNERENRDPSSYLQSTIEHRMILECILEGDADKLYETVRMHLINSASRSQNEAWNS